MFIHAFAKRLCEEKKKSILYDISDYNNHKLGFVYQLKDYFGIQNETSKVNYSDIIPETAKVYETETNCYTPEIFEKEGVYYRGYFQTEKYFKKYRNILLEEFRSKIPFNNEYLDVLKKIENTNSVLLNFRVCMDYMVNGWALDLDYQHEAMKYIASKIENPEFFVFADDIQYIKDNFKSDYKMTFVDLKHPNKICLDLELMKKCKHAIIPNSSFSWWAAWLNENPDKIVIAPDPWFYKPNDIIPEDWHKIKAQKIPCKNPAIV